MTLLAKAKWRRPVVEAEVQPRYRYHYLPSVLCASQVGHHHEPIHDYDLHARDHQRCLLAGHVSGCMVAVYISQLRPNGRRYRVRKWEGGSFGHLPVHSVGLVPLWAQLPKLLPSHCLRLCSPLCYLQSNLQHVAVQLDSDTELSVHELCRTADLHPSNSENDTCCVCILRGLQDAPERHRATAVARRPPLPLRLVSLDDQPDQQAQLALG